MGQQIEMFSQPKGLTHEQKKVIELFNSGKKDNQILALLQCKNVGLSKGKLLHDYVFSDFDQHEIIEDWGICYIDIGTPCVVFWRFLLGGKLSVEDNTQSITLHLPTRKKPIKLADWEGKAIDEIATEVFSKLRELTLKHADYLLGDCLQTRE